MRRRFSNVNESPMAAQLKFLQSSGAVWLKANAPATLKFAAGGSNDNLGARAIEATCVTAAPNSVTKITQCVHKLSTITPDLGILTIRPLNPPGSVSSIGCKRGRQQLMERSVVYCVSIRRTKSVQKMGAV
jgi:hypothetical protein